MDDYNRTDNRTDDGSDNSADFEGRVDGTDNGSVGRLFQADFQTIESVGSLTKQGKEAMKKLKAILKDKKEAPNSYLKQKLAKFFMMVIIVSAELDSIGYVLALLAYQGYSPEVDTFFIVFPIGYALAIFLYIYHGRVGGMGRLAGLGVDGSNAARAGDSDDDNDDDEDVSGVQPFKGNPLRYYHYMPLARTSMLLQDIAHDDVTAIFRVSALRCPILNARCCCNPFLAP